MITIVTHSRVNDVYIHAHPTPSRYLVGGRAITKSVHVPSALTVIAVVLHCREVPKGCPNDSLIWEKKHVSHMISSPYHVTTALVMWLL